MENVNQRMENYKKAFKLIDEIHQNLFDLDYRKPVENNSILLPLLAKDGKIINVSSWQGSLQT